MLRVEHPADLDRLGWRRLVCFQHVSLMCLVTIQLASSCGATVVKIQCLFFEPKTYEYGLPLLEITNSTRIEYSNTIMQQKTITTRNDIATSSGSIREISQREVSKFPLNH